MISDNSNHVGMEALFESARMNVALDSSSRLHLETCEVCRGRLHWMQTATELGAREMQYEPPPSVMDEVLGLVRKPGYFKKFRNSAVASRTFDSSNNMAPAGLRCTASTPRAM